MGHSSLSEHMLSVPGYKMSTKRVKMGLPGEHSPQPRKTDGMVIFMKQ